VCVEASLLKPRAKAASQRDDAKQELELLYDMLEQPWTSSASHSTAGTHPTRTEKKLVTFEGIGPRDDESGVPLATRTVSCTIYTAVNVRIITKYTKK